MSNFYDALERADGIIIATPALFGNVPAKLKAGIDRTKHILKGLRLKDKLGCAISVSLYRNGGQERAIEVVQSWMLLQGMAVVGVEHGCRGKPGLGRQDRNADGIGECQ